MPRRYRRCVVSIGNKRDGCVACLVIAVGRLGWSNPALDRRRISRCGLDQNGIFNDGARGRCESERRKCGGNKCKTTAAGRFAVMGIRHFIHDVCPLKSTSCRISPGGFAPVDRALQNQNSPDWLSEACANAQ